MRKIETQPKVCLICQTTFFRPKNVCPTVWNNRKVCSTKCRAKLSNIGFQKGHASYPNSGQFQKGHVVLPNQTSFKKGQNVWKDKKPAVRFGLQTVFKGMYVSEESHEKRRNARALQTSLPSGKNHWNWNGGTSALRKRIQRLRLYRNWRSEVFKRDDYTCKITECGQRGGTLNADHIKSFALIIRDNKITTVKQAKLCAELWDVSNGRTLCIGCHQKTSNYGGRTVM